MQVRTAKLNDSKRIWEIRNNPVVRKLSGNADSFPFKEHDDWFSDKYFNETINYCYVLENGIDVIGYCRFDFNVDKNNYIISIALDQDFHGQGLGSYLLNNSLISFSNKGEVEAQIRKENLASINLFKKNNFEVFTEDQDYYYLIYKNNG